MLIRRKKTTLGSNNTMKKRSPADPAEIKETMDWVQAGLKQINSPKDLVLDFNTVFSYKWLNKFCWWGLEESIQTLNSQNDNSHSFKCTGSHNSSFNLRRRRKRMTIPDLSSYVASLVGKLNSGKIRFIKPTRKVGRKSSAHKSKRESRFIGVSKNGNSWQVLKNIDKFKHYMGGYVDPKEAAVAYDFYCILIDQERARTNYFYSQNTIRAMLDDFILRGQKFDSKKFTPFVGQNETS